MRFDVQDLSFSYKDNEVLKNVSFTMDEGKSISLLGRNGSGKSTLLRLLLGFITPRQGKIEIDGISLDKIPYNERAKKIAYIPQSSEIAFPTTVLDCVVMGRAPSIGIFSKPKEKDYDIARYYINLLGIEHLSRKSISRISGGERQLALIARALTQDARILLLDEPTTALDYSNQLLVLETIEKLSAKGYSILFSTHNPEQALMLNSSVLLLDKGVSEFYENTKPLIDGKRLSMLYGKELYITEVDTGSNRRLVCIQK